MAESERARSEPPWQELEDLQKAFADRWEAERVERIRWAKSAKGRIAVYTYDIDGDSGAAHLEVYDSYGRFKANDPPYPEALVAAVGRATGDPYEEQLDI
jgi:hypothetical protein